MLRTVFAAWDDGGSISPNADGTVAITVPRRLRVELGAEGISRATFQRVVAVIESADEFAEQPVDFLTPAHPLVEVVLRRLRHDAVDPGFPHRFDVEPGVEEQLVCSFAARFVDGDGRTVEERLLAVAVDADGRASRDAAVDIDLLGLDRPPAAGTPDPSGVQRWADRWEHLAGVTRREAERRAEGRRSELVELAQVLREDELQVLALWHSDQAKQLERLVFGTSTMVTFEQGAELESSRRTLDAELAARRSALRDRSAVRLAQLDLIGGRLYVRPTA